MAARARQVAGIVPETAVRVQWLTAGGMDVAQIGAVLNLSPASISRYRAFVNGALAGLWPEETRSDEEDERRG